MCTETDENYKFCCVLYRSNCFSFRVLPALMETLGLAQVEQKEKVSTY